MRHLFLSVLCITIILTSSQCEKEVVPPYGHLKLDVSYPELVVENDTFYFVKVPGVGAEVSLYDKETICKGYKDAMLGIAWLTDKYVSPEYKKWSNEEGEVLFKDIPVGEYYFVIYARHWSKFTEKNIKVFGGDTLKLIKNFTSDLTFYEDLEPWDYEMPTN